MQILGNALTSHEYVATQTFVTKAIADINSVPAGHIRAEGKIRNLNTIEDFKNVDKAAMLQTAAKQVSFTHLGFGSLAD